MVEGWNKLKQENVDCEHVNEFKYKLEKVRKRKMDFLWTEFAEFYGHTGFCIVFTIDCEVTAVP